MGTSDGSAAATAAATAGKAFRLVVGFLSLAEGEPGDHQGTDGVDAADAGEGIAGAGSQQGHRQVKAGAGAGGVGQDGGGAEGGADLDLGLDQEPHEGDGDEGNDDAPEGGLGRMPLEQRQQGGNHQPPRQQVERPAGDAERPLFELVAGLTPGGADAADHVPDADSGDYLHEGIDPEAEQGEGFVGGAEPDGESAFNKVVDDGEQREKTGAVIQTGGAGPNRTGTG